MPSRGCSSLRVDVLLSLWSDSGGTSRVRVGGRWGRGRGQPGRVVMWGSGQPLRIRLHDTERKSDQPREPRDETHDGRALHILVASMSLGACLPRLDARGSVCPCRCKGADSRAENKLSLLCRLSALVRGPSLSLTPGRWLELCRGVPHGLLLCAVVLECIHAECCVELCFVPCADPTEL